MLEKFMEAKDKGNQFGTPLNDLSKAFDCIDHKLLIANLYEYGVSSSALNIISSYLKHRTQPTKIKACVRYFLSEFCFSPNGEKYVFYFI